MIVATHADHLVIAVALEVAKGLWPNDVIPNAQYLIHDRLNS